MPRLARVPQQMLQQHTYAGVRNTVTACEPPGPAWDSIRAREALSTSEKKLAHADVSKQAAAAAASRHARRGFPGAYSSCSCGGSPLAAGSSQLGGTNTTVRRRGPLRRQPLFTIMLFGQIVCGRRQSIACRVLFVFPGACGFACSYVREKFRTHGRSNNMRNNNKKGILLHQSAYSRFPKSPPGRPAGACTRGEGMRRWHAVFPSIRTKQRTTAQTRAQFHTNLAPFRSNRWVSHRLAYDAIARHGDMHRASTAAGA